MSPSVRHIATRSITAGVVIALILYVVVLVIPLPDAITEIVALIQVPGIWFEIERATPYHVSTLNILRINAAVYAAVCFIFFSLRSRWRSRSDDRTA